MVSLVSLLPLNLAFKGKLRAICIVFRAEQAHERQLPAYELAAARARVCDGRATRNLCARFSRAARSLWGLGRRPTRRRLRLQTDVGARDGVRRRAGGLPRAVAGGQRHGGEEAGARQGLHGGQDR
jgi:hypothetical protein